MGAHAHTIHLAEQGPAGAGSVALAVSSLDLLAKLPSIRAWAGRRRARARRRRRQAAAARAVNVTG